MVEASGQLKTIAVSLFKIANDIRWLGSGPRCGIGEIQLPATQPGSSIMPGKVNPVMCESLMMVCAQVIGNDAAITWAGANGNFELNVMMPVMAHNLLESIRLLGNVGDVFAEKCVSGIEANEERCRELVELSMAMVTSLAPKIGYDRAAEIAKESAKTGQDRARDLPREESPAGSGTERRARSGRDDRARRRRFRRRLSIAIRFAIARFALIASHGRQRQRSAIFRRREHRDQVPVVTPTSRRSRFIATRSGCL